MTGIRYCSPVHRARILRQCHRSVIDATATRRATARRPNTVDTAACSSHLPSIAILRFASPLPQPVDRTGHMSPSSADSIKQRKLGKEEGVLTTYRVQSRGFFSGQTSARSVAVFGPQSAGAVSEKWVRMAMPRGPVRSARPPWSWRTEANTRTRATLPDSARGRDRSHAPRADDRTCRPSVPASARAFHNRTVHLRVPTIASCAALLLRGDQCLELLANGHRRSSAGDRPPFPRLACLAGQEYLKLNAADQSQPCGLGPESAWKSASVSPGKPTMKSDDSRISGRAARMRSTRRHILTRRYACGSSPSGCGPTPTAPADADRASVVAGRHARR